MTNLNNIIDVSEATFETAVIEQSFQLPVVVDFWAPWCGPCRLLSPILEKLANDPTYEFILAKINVDENPNISRTYFVQGIPAVKAFYNGDIIDEFVGVQPESKVRQFLANLIPSELDLHLAEANSLIVTRQWAEAESVLYDILEEYPHNAEATIQLAVALLAQGDGCEAIDHLANCRDGDAFAKAKKLRPLAHYLCRLETSDDEDEHTTIELQYRQTARLFSNGNIEASMDGLLDVLRLDKRYRKGEAKNVLLAIFELLGEDDPLTTTYRHELASVLF